LPEDIQARRTIDPLTNTEAKAPDLPLPLTGGMLTAKHKKITSRYFDRNSRVF